MLNIKEKIKHHFHEVAKTKKSPESIAIGFAIGTAIGLFPTPGFGTLLGVLVILLFEKVNKISVFVAMAIWNPVVCAPFTVMSYALGDRIIGAASLQSTSLFSKAYTFTLKYFLGNIIITATISITTYFIVKYAVILYRKRKKK